MKRNDITALQEKTVEQLNKQLSDLQKQVAAARLQKTVGKLTNPSQIQVMRNDIARVKTVLRQRQLTGVVA